MGGIKNLLLFLTLVLIAALPLYAADKASVQSPKPPASNAAAGGSPEASSAFDIVLLMDSSGSMKKTDPMNYRKPAAQLFSSLIDPKDRLAVVSFGDKSTVLLPFTPNTPDNRAKINTAINKVSSKEFSTNITDAVKTAYELLKSSTNKNRIIIMMSDGKLALGDEKKDEAAHAELEKLLPELAGSGIKLYSIAFTEESDIKLLEHMSKVGGGFFRFAKTDKDIHVIFTSMFEKIKAPNTIPLEGDAFSIDSDIKEAILVISKKEGTRISLVDPAGGKHIPSRYGKNITWYETPVFDMITIKEPTVGKWQVSLSAKEGNRVFVLTNLNLKTSADKSFYKKGESLVIEAWLEREGIMLKEKEVLQQISFHADVLGPDGKAVRLDLKDSSGTSGKYSAGFVISSVGEYSIKIAAEGKTFKREKNIAIKADEPPVQDTKNTSAKEKSKPSDKRSWRETLLIFGIINGAIVGALLIILLIKKFLSRTKSPKKKKGKK
jgi:Mg-chelatase subunit ChlD